MRSSDVSRSEITSLLCMVRGVENADVALSADGEIRKIEIAVRPGHDARRIIRDVESALYTGLGVVVDHRTISIVGSSTGNGRNNGDVARTLQFSSTGSVVEGSRSPSRIELVGVSVDPDGELFCEVVVELSRKDGVFRATERDADTPGARLMMAGRATIEALGTALDQEVALSLEGIEEFAICENPALIAAIRSRRGRALRSFVGTALIEGSREEAAARAVLSALNRFWMAEGDPNA